MRKQIRSRLRSTIVSLAIAIPIAFSISFVFPTYVVATESMTPTIPAGSYVIRIRASLLPESVRKDDIVVFQPVEGISSYPWIHRLIAEAGEHYSPVARKGRMDVSLDGTAVKNDGATDPLLVPDDFFYQSGDSATSFHGLVPKRLVTGKVIVHFKLPWTQRRGLR